ncbi:hypothetical protein HK100_009445 [Physocladia obscura]|uniref:Enoyl reductase (ER) domain-containing protein n=1 Tax=Physocladia obscura TaxID=109957 RepID=A0AAD5XF45_9FUNG|nr:hypothetical protein HK100_009445 [Physocladia obscura]
MQIGIGVTVAQQPIEKFSFDITEPTGHQLLIKVIAAGRYNPISNAVNPMDGVIPTMDESRVKMFIPNFPGPLAFEVSGVVVKRGEDVIGFPAGSRVLSAAIGGLAEFAIVDSRFAAIIPSNFSPVLAGGFGVNANTTAFALFSPNGLGLPFPGTSEAVAFDYNNKNIVISGAGTGNGKLAIQLARIVGFGKIIAIGSANGVNELKEFGATHVIDRNATDIEAQVRSIAGDEVVYVYETIGRDSKLAPALLSEKLGGTIAHIIPSYKPEIPNSKTDKVAVKLVFGWPEQNLETAKLFWQALPNWLENGDLKLKKVHVIKGLDVDEVKAALEKILAFSGGVKYIVQVSELD